MPFDKGWTAGSTTMLVLALLAQRDLYGYEMIEELARRSNNAFAMKEGTLYPILHALERKKCLTSYEQAAPSGRMRKYYHLTKKGRELLGEKTAEWRSFSESVNGVLQFGG
jgi:PadR family transcriptional regulator PadR